MRPLFLLDGHGSRLELPFLTYVNDPGHPWVICIGVLFGTSYWQGRDSSEQNGDCKGKERISIEEETYETINIVNAAWEKSFSHV